jgi:lipopolysaccharide heptosyltransferase I
VKVLVVKMSSMGDVVHTLPAIVEARQAIPEISFHWVVEEGFKDIPGLHPLVDEVIPVAIRRWRKNAWACVSDGEFAAFYRALTRHHYDLIIDAQGLIKSALVGWLASGPVSGFNRQSAREPAASLTYHRSVAVDMNLHAVERQRLLFSNVLDYQVGGKVDYGFDSGCEDTRLPRTVILLHGTTWESKLWPRESWRALCKLLVSNGYEVLIPSGNTRESSRATFIAADTGARILNSMRLPELMALMETCSAAVSVDTGLGHLASAMDIPLVALYGATDPGLTGVYGEHQQVIVSDHLPCIPCRKRICRYPVADDSSKIYPPCFEQITPESVWQALQLQISKANHQPA